jgi:hypothetical protein
MTDNTINPALQNLQHLVGKWDMEISNASFLPSLSEVISADARFEWFDDGDFLILRQGVKGGDTPWASWFIGRDDDSADYTVLYIDERRFSRVYGMSLEGDSWKIWRNTPEFTQSFEGRISADRQTITGAWSKSFDKGKSWEHDFDLRYTKHPTQ